MKTIEYTHDDQHTLRVKSAPGPWQDECDKKQWQDEATLLPCLIVRNRMGALCGYVGVPPDHPYHGKGYEDVGDHDVHGGLTFADRCHPKGKEEPESHVCHITEPGEEDGVWWLGFDCGHGMDVMPAMQEGLGRTPGETYKNIAFVEAECKKLARQLKAVQS